MSKDGEKPEVAHPLVRLAVLVKAALLRELNPVERDVLMVYASFANTRATSWPSAETIRRLTGHSRTRIFEAIRVLRRLKIIEQVGRTVRKGMEELGGRGPMIYAIARPPESLPEGFALFVHAARTSGPVRVYVRRTHSTKGRFHSPRHGEVPSTPHESHSPHDGKVKSTSRESERPHHEDRKGFEGVIEGVKEQGGKEGEYEGKPRGELRPPLGVSLSRERRRNRRTPQGKNPQPLRGSLNTSPSFHTPHGKDTRQF